MNAFVLLGMMVASSPFVWQPGRLLSPVDGVWLFGYHPEKQSMVLLRQFDGHGNEVSMYLEAIDLKSGKGLKTFTADYPTDLNDIITYEEYSYVDLPFSLAEIRKYHVKLLKKTPKVRRFIKTYGRKPIDTKVAKRLDLGTLGFEKRSYVHPAALKTRLKKWVKQNPCLRILNKKGKEVFGQDNPKEACNIHISVYRLGNKFDVFFIQAEEFDYASGVDRIFSRKSIGLVE